MSAELYTEPRLLTEVAEHLERVRTDVGGAVQRLRGTVDGTGNPWGADGQGSMFGSLYTELMTHVIDVMDSHQDELSYAAGTLRWTADDQQRTDEAVGEVFRGLGGDLGGI